MANIGHSLFNRTIGVMGKSLGLRLVRHGMTSTNLANIDTPGYTVKNLQFEKTLQNALGNEEGKLAVRQTNGKHMPRQDIEKAYGAARKDMEYSPYGQDEKGEDVVDIDMEMTKLAKNQLIYNATVQLLAKEFEGLKYAITEGGR